MAYKSCIDSANKLGGIEPLKAFPPRSLRDKVQKDKLSKDELGTIGTIRHDGMEWKEVQLYQASV